jgi:CPA1 family monovalent cation:H+ antiporter
MEQFLIDETIITEFTPIVFGIAIPVRRPKAPYTLALALTALALTFAPLPSFAFNLTSELILALVIPPLIFEAASRINLENTRHNLPAILWLAIPGAILTTFIIGGLLSLVTSLALPVALVFGALISATDPVAVVGIFRAPGVPKPLAKLVEGENLLNTGIAIVVFNLAVAIALTNQFNLLQSLGDIMRVSIGGATLGLMLGWFVTRLITLADDRFIKTSLTVALAFVAYLAAERLYFNGALSVATAGLVYGNLRQPGMSPTARIVIARFWEYLVFLANALIFLLIGLEVELFALLGAWQSVLWAIVAAFAGRMFVVYSLGGIMAHLTNHLQPGWLHALNWSGVRGAVALALVLSLPADWSVERDLMIWMAFGVVLFSLLVQTATLQPMLRYLGRNTRLPEHKEYEKRFVRLTAARVAFAYLEYRHAKGLVSDYSWAQLKPQLSQQVEVLASAWRDRYKTSPSLDMEELAISQREALQSALLGLLQDGMISADEFDELAVKMNSSLGANVLPASPFDPAHK